MRVLLLLALCATAADAQPERRHRLVSAPLAITLPADFETRDEAAVGETALAAETSVQIFSRVGVDHSPNTYVIVETHRGLSTLQRFLFRRGVGLQRQTPSIAFERIDLARLPLAKALAASAGSAFVATREADRSSVGVVVRGCEGEVCYAVMASGPSGPAADGMTYAPLLAGLEVTD
ncbi:hypothetical protein [Rubrivirga sp. IMCC43871]|uniref:hypothetical protein n=1 Tax=Rubrivirga sp. IMCC43871 TaxID=3391575 RepID=UPI00399025F3